jgi:hypothetical protein
MDVLVASAVERVTKAVERFDKSSSELVTTTNNLTNRILVLTRVVVGLGVIQVIATLLTLWICMQ